MDDKNNLQARLDRIGQWDAFRLDWPTVRQNAAGGIVDLCALSVGLHPECANLVLTMLAIDPDVAPTEEEIQQRSEYRNANITEWERRVILAVNHIKAGALPTIGKPGVALPSNAADIWVKVADFAIWAEGLGWKLPDGFIATSQGQSVEPPHQDGEDLTQKPTPESPASRAAHRLARLRELGGNYIEYGRDGKTTGRRGALAALIREETAAGRPMCRKADIRKDLLKAIREKRDGSCA
jgi:hypothetical protein